MSTTPPPNEPDFGAKQKQQLLEIIDELERARTNFSVTIQHVGGAWEIKMWSAEVKGGGARGVGATFAEAWDNMAPLWAK